MVVLCRVQAEMMFLDSLRASLSEFGSTYLWDPEMLKKTTDFRVDIYLAEIKDVNSHYDQLQAALHSAMQDHVQACVMGQRQHFLACLQQVYS